MRANLSRSRLLLLSALLIVGACGDGPKHGQSSSTSAIGGDEVVFSKTPRAEAERELIAIVDTLTASVGPDLRWQRLPDGSEGGFHETGCFDDAGNETEYVSIPYTAKTERALDPADVDSFLNSAFENLSSEGFSVERATIPGTRRIGGSNQAGYFVSVELVPATGQIAVDGVTPCVK